MKLTGIV
jgi:hypothetical protein